MLHFHILTDCRSPDITNGFLAAGSSTFYDGTATVECVPGYEVVGSNVAHCNTSAFWDILPQCTPVGK